MIRVGIKRVFILVFCLLIFISIAFLNNNQSLNQKESLGIHKVKFFEEKYFNEGVEKVKDTKPFTYHISGGIIPHDLFPAFIIADFFKRLSYQNPATIILLGPNHYEKGDFKALTSLYNWETPFGNVAPDENIIKTLINHNLVKVDEEVLPEDHAVSGSIPFIKFFMPQVKVVPILLSIKMSQQDSELLADKLSDLSSKDVVIVAPVDFSHYLTSREAKAKDEITLKVIKGFDYKTLFLLNNDYLDSPPSIGTLLLTMQKLGATNSDLLYHTNSGEIQKNEYIQTTSYFSLNFYNH